MKIPHFITLTTVSATLSFLCFILDGRFDVAIGGLLGQTISHTAVELKYRKYFFDVKPRNTITHNFLSNVTVEPVIENAKYAVFVIGSFVLGLIGYNWQIGKRFKLLVDKVCTFLSLFLLLNFNNLKKKCA